MITLGAAFTNQLIHTCTIQRDTGTGQSADGAEIEDFTTLASGVQCFIVHPSWISQFEQEFASRFKAVQEDRIGLFLSTQDVRTTDRVLFESDTLDIVAVRDAGGQGLFQIVYMKFTRTGVA